MKSIVELLNKYGYFYTFESVNAPMSRSVRLSGLSLSLSVGWSPGWFSWSV